MRSVSLFVGGVELVGVLIARLDDVVFDEEERGSAVWL